MLQMVSFVGDGILQMDYERKHQFSEHQIQCGYTWLCDHAQPHSSYPLFQERQSTFKLDARLKEIYFCDGASAD